VKLPERGYRRLLTVAATVAAAAAAALSLSLAAVPAAGAAATAGLNASGWHAVGLPDPVYPGWPSLASCVPGTSFCLTISDLEYPTTLSYTATVTTDAGASWQSYDTLSAALRYPDSVSCPTTSVCWVAGRYPAGAPGLDPSDVPGVAESVDGGQTWTTVRAPGGWPDTWQLQSIDCLSATTCWLAGDDTSNGVTPVLLETTDGGADWTTFTNLPGFTRYDPNGTYQLNAISCTSALACVAGGGLNLGDGLAQIITTTDGGATWTRSTDPMLTGLQMVFALSCLNGAGGLPTCFAAADANAGAGPVVINSADGGATWDGTETYDDTGWMYSIACPDTAHCWATGAGTTVGLAGTADGGSTWTVATSSTSNQEGSVACASVAFCVSTTDDALWQTAGAGASGGQPVSAAPARAAAVKPVVTRLPKVSGTAVSALAGHAATVTGQYRAAHSGTARVTFTLPTGKVTSGSAAIGLNGYYTVKIAGTPKGATKVQVSVNGKANQTVTVHGYPAPAPAIASMSVHAGPAAGGTAVTIKGANFRHVTGVYFGSSLVRNVQVTSATQLTVKAPAGNQARYVTVVTRDGGPSPLTGRAVFNFLPKPALTALSPASGAPGGGTTVTIAGSNFGYVKAVYFGNSPAPHAKVISARAIKVTAPPGAGQVPVTVVTAGGTTPVASAGYFTY